MARFYARFDGGTETPLDGTTGTEGYFTKLRIAASSASAALLRDGLLTSKSLLSTDVYADLDPVNKNGQLGIYFPYDTDVINIPADISWPTAYTSSEEGIKIPTTNTYGISDSINYSLRVQSGVSYTASIVTASSPLDPIGASWATYTSASTAVLAVVNTIQTTPGGVAQTPFTRGGTYPSRTMHSLWSNPGTDYFAWDDFTPGTMSTSGMDIQVNGADCDQTSSPGATSTISFNWNVVNSYEFKNDGNSAAKIGLEIKVSKASGATGTCDTYWGPGVYKLQLGYQASIHGGPVTLGTATSGNGPSNPSITGNVNCRDTVTFPVTTWSWNGQGAYNSGGSPTLQWTLRLADCVGGDGGYEINAYTKLYDAVITGNSTIGTILTEYAAIPNSP